MTIALVVVLGVLGLWQGATPKRIAMLYLGHNSKHHDSGTYAPMLRDAPHGIDLVYSADPNDLNAAWDETNVHTKHNPDRTVLMERVDAAGREPWTRVRTHGKGRVFYTASGHDARVWSHPTFHHLVRNAVVWAANTR